MCVYVYLSVSCSLKNRSLKMKHDFKLANVFMLLAVSTFDDRNSMCARRSSCVGTMHRNIWCKLHDAIEGVKKEENNSFFLFFLLTFFFYFAFTFLKSILLFLDNKMNKMHVNETKRINTRCGDGILHYTHTHTYTQIKTRTRSNISATS